jgi:hypothetical protein
MTSRATWLAALLVGIAGCDDWFPRYPWRLPCEEDAAPGTCCPLGSHLVVGMIKRDIVCVADEVPCADAGADADACPEAGSDAP